MTCLIVQLWKQVDTTHLALLDARAKGDEKAAKACGLQWRCLALTMCSIPASSVAEVELKTYLAALYREELSDRSYTLTMIEHCVALDRKSL
jgi:hypothetical protein